jgi:hypothetical protein
MMRPADEAAPYARYRAVGVLLAIHPGKLPDGVVLLFGN